mgnify:FL=1
MGFPQLFETISAINFEEHGREDDHDSKDSDDRDGMLVHDARQKDGHGLSERHDDDKDHGPERSDRVVDEELADGRTDGQNDAIESEGRIL